MFSLYVPTANPYVSFVYMVVKSTVVPVSANVKLLEYAPLGDNEISKLEGAVITTSFVNDVPRTVKVSGTISTLPSTLVKPDTKLVSGLIVILGLAEATPLTFILSNR